MSLSHYADLFRAESREHLSAVNHLLLALEADPSEREPVEGVFRAVHTIKGMAATMGYAEVAEVAHEMESVLDRLRGRGEAVTPELVEVLFRATDAIAAGIVEEAGVDGAAPDPEILAALRAAAGRTEGGTPRNGHPAAPAASAPAAGEALRVRVTVAADAPLPGVRAFMVLHAARQLGEVCELSPPEEALHDTGFDGVLAFSLRTLASEAEVGGRIGAVGDIAAVEVAAPVHPTASVTSGPAPAAGNGGGGGPPAVVRPIGAGGVRSSDRHVRVEAARLDSLMDRIGEMVIVRDRLRRVAATLDSEALAEPVDQIDRLINEMREDILGIRMVGIREVFDRFPRLVRDASRALGKRVDLSVEGHEIELDRSLIERLGDPLVHLVRNALDHGIESPAERAARGKPEAGRLTLTAQRERSRILIRIEDDGRGIDRRRVVARAVELGLIAAPATPLTDEEVFALMTRPGLSTAAQVTDVSGRGVGLDVVATQVRALGGTLEITSREGEGTSFLLRLPLTVGIMRALLVTAGGSTYAIPVAHVVETVEFAASEVREVAGRRIALLRGEPVPLVRLGDALGATRTASGAEHVPVVLLEREEQWIGLEVEGFLGQQEIVTKQFDAARGMLPLFVGATILSDGRPALILDAAALVPFGRAAATPSAAGHHTHPADGR